MNSYFSHKKIKKKRREKGKSKASYSKSWCTNLAVVARSIIRGVKMKDFLKRNLAVVASPIIRGVKMKEFLKGKILNIHNPSEEEEVLVGKFYKLVFKMGSPV